MIIIEALLCGILAGLTCFFPVSSMGAIILFTKFTGFNVSFSFFEALLLGLTFASASLLYKDLFRVLLSFLEIIRDLFYNLSLYIQRNKYQGKPHYRRILTSNYRNFGSMILISIFPAVLFGLFLQPIVRFAYKNVLFVGMGYMLTSLLLLVSSFMRSGDKNPKKIKTVEAVIIGVADGFAFIPGISKIAMGTSVGFLCGLSKKLALKYAYLMNLLCIIMMIIPSPLSFSRLEVGLDYGMIIAAFAGAFVSGFFAIRFAKQSISRQNNRVYAIVNIIFALLAAFAYLLTR